MSRPELIAICGPNGSGKSSVYKARVESCDIADRPFVNADELLVRFRAKETIRFSDFGLTTSSAEDFNLTVEDHEFTGKIRSGGQTISLLAEGNPPYLRPDDSVSEYEAAIAADVFRQLLIREKVSFSFETVMSHPAKTDLLNQAGARGYRVILIFVCTNSAALNVDRVRRRVLEGGHDVPKDKIISRYYRAIQNLRGACAASDEAILVDTTSDDGSFEVVAAKAHGVWTKLAPLPTWVTQAFPDGLPDA